MKIAVIGAGNVGSTLGLAWAKRGHQVVFGVRNPVDDRYLSLTSMPNVVVTSNHDAVKGAEVVALATPWPATRDAVESCGNLEGKTIIDCTNPVSPYFTGLVIGHDTSGAESIAQWANGANVIKAMNQIGFASMGAPNFPGGKPVMFVCGSHGTSKLTVIDLVTELGFEAVDAGNLEIARLLEPLAMLWIHLAVRQGMGREFAFSILRKHSMEQKD